MSIGKQSVICNNRCNIYPKEVSGRMKAEKRLEKLTSGWVDGLIDDATFRARAAEQRLNYLNSSNPNIYNILIQKRGGLFEDGRSGGI